MNRGHVNRPPGRVVVGMSGGVDSAVTAALLKEEGFDVIGVTMQIWHRSTVFEDEAPSAGCCTIDAVDDARRVAGMLNIPYYVPNFRQPFSVVVDDFVEQYAKGRTPNPCIRCNQFVRFDGLLAKADEVEADYIATGHYAQVEYDPSREEYVLKKAVDSSKDQSYVLHTLTQRHLSRLLTPLGGLTKAQTRSLAQEMGLPVSTKPDSQEICFVAGGNYRDFLEEVGGLGARPGPVVDGTGTVVGEHMGLHNYTIGQRKGLGLRSQEPAYVVELRPEQNTLVVGRREDVAHHSVVCEDLHFPGSVQRCGFDAHVRVRSHAEDIPARIRVEGDEAHVQFCEPVWAASPGQSAVFYEGDRVIGGGTITTVAR